MNPTSKRIHVGPWFDRALPNLFTRVTGCFSNNTWNLNLSKDTVEAVTKRPGHLCIQFVVAKNGIVTSSSFLDWGFDGIQINLNRKVSIGKNSRRSFEAFESFKATPSRSAADQSACGWLCGLRCQVASSRDFEIRNAKGQVVAVRKARSITRLCLYFHMGGNPALCSSFSKPNAI